MLVSLHTFTLIHVLLSVVGLVAGLVVAGGLASGRRLDPWALLFLITTIGTSATGFGFPSDSLLPSHVVGAVSLVVLAAVAAAHFKALTGAWGRVYAIGVVLATYLNAFVLVVQLFRRVPALSDMAPTQSEPPFAITQGIVLLLFIWAGFAAFKGARAVHSVR